jgi:hypothetical protein
VNDAAPSTAIVGERKYRMPPPSEALAPPYSTWESSASSNQRATMFTSASRNGTQRLPGRRWNLPPASMSMRP